MNKPAIETGKYWDRAWSLVENCTRVSPGCDNCWLQAINHRFHREGPVIFREDRLELPLRVKKPTTWSIWSDFLHAVVTNTDRDRALAVMATCLDQNFLILTKRANDMQAYFSHTLLEGRIEGWMAKNTHAGIEEWPLPNVWLGVTAENQEQADKRIPLLLQTPAAHRFVSIEPMLGPIDLVESGVFWTSFRDNSIVRTKPSWRLIDWVIVGCETGTGRRLCKHSWIRGIRDQCTASGVPLWIKQIPTIPGYKLWISHDMSEWPENLRIRQMPEGMIK